MKPYYLVKLADKQPKLETQADAVTESLRLAKQNPGLSFEILKCVAISQTSEANTFWMDGEEPTEKPRYRMLEQDETIQSGDQYQIGEVWHDYSRESNSIGQEFHPVTHRPHRRPIKP